jgi:hypothetical protein
MLVPEDAHRNGNRTAAQREQAMGTLVRSVITVAYGKFNPDVTTETFVRRRWRDSETAGIGLMLRAASTPAMTSTAGWAKELAHTTQAFLGALTPLSAGADLLDRGLQLTFDGAAVISIANITAPLADFIAQGAPMSCPAQPMFKQPSSRTNWARSSCSRAR